MVTHQRFGKTKDQTLLEPTQRARLDHWGGVGWLKWAARLNARRRALRTIGRLVEAQRTAKAAWPEDPRVLAKLLAVSLRADGSVVDHFEKRRASDLQTDEEWGEFFSLLALGLLELWLRRRDEEGGPPEAPGLVVEDEYLDSLTDLLELAQQEGKKNQAEAQAEDRASTFNLATISDLTGETLESLRAYLAESDVFAQPASANGDIPENVQAREIEVAALSRLKLADLEELAAAKGLPLVASKERLAELIVGTNVTREEIAELALRESELSIDTGLVTRLFPLAAPPDLSNAATRLSQAQGRYLKLRLARWFIYDEARMLDSVVVLRGRMRSYRSKPVLEVEGHRLNVDPHSAKMVVRLRKGRKWAEVDGRQVSDARDIGPVLTRGAGVSFEKTLTLPLPALDGTMASWSRRTVWMLVLLQLHLESDDTSILNYAMAHFEAPRSEPARPDEPRIAEVELRGQHVGDSRDACQRIIEGAGLLAVELKLAFVPNNLDSYVVPVRIGIDDTCATIETGAGQNVPAAVSTSLHRALIDRLCRALDTGLDPSGLGSLVRKIVDRARAPEQAPHADMFAPTPKVERVPIPRRNIVIRPRPTAET